jgi:hypothetical protein
MDKNTTPSTEVIPTRRHRKTEAGIQLSAGPETGFVSRFDMIDSKDRVREQRPEVK